MSAILATQPGPLTWVKPEIDFALERARINLRQYFEEPDGNADALAAAAASAREVTGALQIIGMDALSAFSREIDAVIMALVATEIPPSSEVARVLDEASRGLEQYLSELMGGVRENAMALRALMIALAEVRGSQPADERALFHPDLNVYPAQLTSGIVLEGTALCEVVRQQRARYQRGMLAWLRGSTDGLVTMRDALQQIEHAQPSPGRRVPWWVASAFVEGLLEEGFADSADTKRAASRIDRCLAAFASGVPASTELIRELLFHLAHCEPVTPLVCDVKALYELDRCLPSASVSDVRETDSKPIGTIQGDHSLLQAVAGEMSETLQQVEGSLDAFLRGQAPNLPLRELPELMRSVTGALSVLGVESAAHIIDRCISIITTLERPNRVVSVEESTLLAEGLSSVILYVKSLDRNNENELRAIETILARFDAREALINSASAVDLQTTAEDATTSDSNELDFEIISSEECVSCDAVEVTTGEIKQILKHYDLTALQDQSAAAEAGDVSQLSVQNAISEGEVRSIASSAESLVEIDARGEGVDPEIVSIFVEEANELLQEMGALLERARAQPHDLNNLICLKRTFHTIKGSGRMAGLRAIGDAAWTIESLLNEWGETERPASDELVEFLLLGRDLFSRWIDDIAQQGRTSVQMGMLSERAERVAREANWPGPRNACATETESADAEPVVSLEMPLDALADGPIPEVFATGVSTLPASLFQIFVDESRQHVEVIRTVLSANTTAEDHDALERLTRAAHTLGGIARTTGFADIALVAGIVENAPLGHVDWDQTLAILNAALASLASLVTEVAEGRLPELDTDVRAGFASHAATFEARAFVEQFPEPVDASSRSPEDHNPEPEETTENPGASQEAGGEPKGAPDRRLLKDDIDPQLLSIFLDEVRDLGPLIGEDLRHLRKVPTDLATFDSIRRVLHTIKGGVRMIGAIRLGELVHIMEGRLEEAAERGSIGADTLDLLEAEFDRLSGGFELLERGGQDSEHGQESRDDSLGKDHEAKATDAREASASVSPHIRVAADTVDRLLNQAGEISISRGRIDTEARTFKQFLLELTESVARLRGQLKEIEIQAESRLQATQQPAAEHGAVFDPLELDRFTRFQELTRLMAESLHDVTTVQQHLLDSLNEVQAALSAESRLNRALQDDLMRLRTVTFQTVGERLHRVVRQAARDTGKNVEFHLAGGHVEVDRGVLERIAAPLEHLVRNSVIHGIESPDERMRAGKPESGTIRLTLLQETNDLLVALDDDGRGIDHERVQAKAIELGWLDANARPSKSDLEQLILRPGFSTASELSELAGRGVGMDVVANEVGALGGDLAIETEQGCGTKFTIRVPLTLAVAKAVLVSASGRRWAILSNLVEQVQEVHANHKPDSDEGLEWLGHRYPLFYLPHLLGEKSLPSSDHTKHFALLMRNGDRRIALLVDSVAVNQDLVMKPLGPQLAGLPGVNGVSVLPDGDVVFVINPVLLLERHRIEKGSFAGRDSADTCRAAPLIMVVDDSLTVRNVTSRLLVRHGYRVTTARDGLDALQQVQESTPDALLVDIEMPRMDGFELTKKLKSSERTSNLPIIMITSRLAPKHRAYADQLGVNVYLGKPYEEHELLAHLHAFAPVLMSS